MANQETLSFEFKLPEIKPVSASTINKIRELEHEEHSIPYKVPINRRPLALRMFPLSKTICLIEGQDPDMSDEEKLDRVYRTPEWHIDSGENGAIAGYVIHLLTSRYPTMYAAGFLSVELAFLKDQWSKIITEEPGLGERNDNFSVNDVLTIIDRYSGHNWVEECIENERDEICEGVAFHDASFIQALPCTIQSGTMAQTLHKSARVHQDIKVFPSRFFLRAVSRTRWWHAA